MHNDTLPNAEQIEYWNEKAGPRWVMMQEALDRQIAQYGEAVMDRAGIAAGDSVLDIGCGCGGTTVEIGRRVGRNGNVLGIDISRVMLDRAEERARVGQFKHVQFAQADAQTHPFEAGAFDMALSRFGVMFFQDPPAAFANIRRALKPGGRLAFICWRDPRENPWMMEPMMAVADLVEMPPPPDPHEPGPFAFAEEDYTRGILEKAGYSGIALERFDEPILMAAGANIDATIDFYFQIGPLSRLLAETTDETKAAVVERLREVLAPRATRDGVSFGASAWIVSATA